MFDIPADTTTFVYPFITLPDSIKTVSLFESHALIPQNYEIKKREVGHDYIVFFVLLFVFSSFVWLYAFQKKTLQLIIKDFFQFGPIASRPSNEKFSQKQTQLFLFSIFVITLTIFIKSILKYYNVVLLNGTIPDELFIGIAIILIYFTKLLVIRLLGNVLKFKEEAKKHVIQSILFTNSLGLFLMPIIILLVFFKQAPSIALIGVGSFLLVALWATRSINGVLLGLNNAKFSKIYLFIYLCTLEILPLVVFAKILLIIFG